MPFFLNYEHLCSAVFDFKAADLFQFIKNSGFVLRASSKTIKLVKFHLGLIILVFLMVKNKADWE